MRSTGALPGSRMLRSSEKPVTSFSNLLGRSYVVWWKAERGRDGGQLRARRHAKQGQLRSVRVLVYDEGL